MKTIHDILTHGVQKLEEASVDTPKLDAEVLLSHVLRIKRFDLILKRDKAISEEHHARFSKLLDERVHRRPVSQLVGMREFWSLPITVNEHVLTPRPETEGIVEFSLERFPKDAKLNILDLCTGSGCITAALATEFCNARITATDISPKALEVARENLAFASDRVELLEGNLFEPICHCEERKRRSNLGVKNEIAMSASRPPRDDNQGLFDLIVSNPPYISEDDYCTLPPEVRDYEPVEALEAGRDGLAILSKIAQYAPRYINSGGWLVLEIGMGQARAVSEMLLDTEEFSRIEVRRDLAGIERIVGGKKQ